MTEQTIRPLSPPARADIMRRLDMIQDSIVDLTEALTSVRDLLKPCDGVKGELHCELAFGHSGRHEGEGADWLDDF